MILVLPDEAVELLRKKTINSCCEGSDVYMKRSQAAFIWPVFDIINCQLKKQRNNIIYIKMGSSGLEYVWINCQ